MTESITVRGFAGTTPELKIAGSGTQVTTFRLASTPRWRNSTTGEWASGETNWYTVAAFGPFAENVAQSISKGDAVVVLGRPKIRHWENSEKATSGTEVEISAQSVGHDLKFGLSRFAKVNRHEAESGEQASAEQTEEASDDGTAPVPDHPATASVGGGWDGDPALQNAP
ncbi:single-stranded DNA-binding protein [Nesterenkonia muleiensis]|uniref:single-stranded DNA-binding protein n=1 Tax=Nesterenkonia muleiensis TaxID=2282648 RepID=UPI000E748A65|nr:single-stranded DNA-binding protein [Nesterenkonia muleiensis]